MIESISFVGGIFLEFEKKILSAQKRVKWRFSFHMMHQSWFQWAFS